MTDKDLAERPKRLYTIAAVAEELDVCSRTVRRWIDTRLLAAHRLGRQWRVGHDDLRAFLAARRRE
jgi:excisionase family DNA binding protein